MQPAFIYWPPCSSEQLVVKCLVQGHLDSMRKPHQTSEMLHNTEKRARVNRKNGYLEAAFMLQMVLDEVIYSGREEFSLNQITRTS